MPAASPEDLFGEDDSLNEVFAALADPTRRAILARLAGGEATVNELAEPFPMSLQAVSKHLKVLERAGLVSRSREAQWRPVRLEDASLDLARRWIEDHRAMRSAQLDRLDQAIQRIRRGELPQPTKSVKAPTPRRRSTTTRRSTS
ncbi:MAG: metalloregulator ArsR/SmtB family transcription factor [Candidatus Nanopelagicales bacterium]